VSHEIEGQFDETVSMIEGLVQRSFREARGRPGPGREVRRAAEDAAPEFERLWALGRSPSIAVDRVGGRLVIRVKDGGV
jgi:hypothetical protein